MSDPVSVTDLVELGRQKVTGNLLTSAFDVHGVTTRLATDSVEVTEAISALLRPFRIDEVGDFKPDIEVFLFASDSLEDKMVDIPAETPLLYDWDAVKIYHSENRRYLTLDTRARVSADIEQRRVVGFVLKASLDSDWLISHQVFYPLWAQLLKLCGLYPFHAAGLTQDSKAYLFPGRSGSGKSTLSLRLVKSGYGILSDDTVFLREMDGTVEALSFPEEINVTDETQALFPDLAKVKNFTVNELRQKSSFAIEELYPESVRDRSVPVMMVFPEITGSDSTSVLPMTRTEALAFSMRFGFFFIDPSTTGRHFEILSILVRQAECFRLNSGRDEEEWVRVTSRLLSDGYEDQSSGERK